MPHDLKSTNLTTWPWTTPPYVNGMQIVELTDPLPVHISFFSGNISWQWRMYFQHQGKYSDLKVFYGLFLRRNENKIYLKKTCNSLHSLNSNNQSSVRSFRSESLNL